MSRDYDYNGIEQAAAIAAAAYVITTLEDSGIPEQKYINEDRTPSLTRITSKKEDTPDSIPDSDGESRLFSGEGPVRNPESLESKLSEIEAIEEKITVNFAGPDPSIKRTPTFPDNRLGPAPSINKTPTFADAPAPPLKKTATFADKLLESMDDETPGSVAPTKNNLPPTKSDIRVSKPEMEMPQPRLATSTTPVSPTSKIEKQQPTVPGSGGTKADVWERAELAKIKERHENLNTRIRSWENKKKAKARHRFDRTEMRSKALEQFRIKMHDIDQIAGAARAKAAERERNEEFKANAKANKIRETGTIPKTCFCF